MAAVALLSLKKTKIVLFGTGFYFFTVAFVLQFISVGVVIMADRYSYLPYVGFAFMLAMLVETYLPKSIKYGIYGISAIAALFWMTSTKSQVDSWQDSEALWGKVISTYPNQEQPHSIRGNFYGKMASRSIEQKNPQKQQEYMNKAAEDFQIAIKLKSERPDVYEGMGNIFGMRGDNQKALEMYSLAIKYNPNKATIYINRGIAYSFKGDLQASLKDMEKAVQLEPKPNHIFYRGIARQRVGDLAGAKADYENVLKLDPGNKQATEQLKTIK
jgi:tetratricopeptide (TPR) repeat protein